jgi:NAD-dependent DNA ligase
MDEGYDDIASILAMTPADFLKVNGFKEKTAQKLFKNIDTTIKAVSLPVLMKATNIFGRGLGEKKLEPILQAYPDILQSEESSQAKLDKLVKMKGLGEKTAKLFVDNIDAFKVFLVKAKLLYKLEEYIKTLKKVVKIEGPLSGKTVIMTGFRDKELIELIKKAGGKMGSSVSKSTFKVIVQDMDQDTDKANKARKLGILILEGDFRKKFL